MERETKLTNEQWRNQLIVIFGMSYSYSEGMIFNIIRNTRIKQEREGKRDRKTSETIEIIKIRYLKNNKVDNKR